MAATRFVLFAATASWRGVTPEPFSLSTANRSTEDDDDDDDEDAVLDTKKDSIVLGLEYVHSYGSSTWKETLLIQILEARLILELGFQFVTLPGVVLEESDGAVDAVGRHRLVHRSPTVVIPVKEYRY